MDADRQWILTWLKEEDPERLELLWEMADTVRREYVGDAVHLRGLIEISNHCVRQCVYCGLRAGNSRLERYRMSEDEVCQCVRRAEEYGFGTVVLQSGEDYGLTARWVESLIRRIKEETGLIVTLSLGERSNEELAVWRRAGADRYFLRFETSDAELYSGIHPSLSGRPSDRVAILQFLRTLGYEVGSGVMIGIPGQSFESLAEDILTFGCYDLDMIGVGPYLSHPATPMGSGWRQWGLPSGEQVPNSEMMVYKVIALTRVTSREANIPSTTALATVNRKKGYELGLMRGANVIMPNLTPFRYRALYDIYPEKTVKSERFNEIEDLLDRIRSIGRTIGKGPGGRARGTDTIPAGRVTCRRPRGEER